MRQFWVWVLGILCVPLVAMAQTAPALIADLVEYDPNRDVLIATGNVEVFYENRILKADKVIYYNETGLVEASGPLRLESDGEETIVAEFATLDPELRSGVTQGARMVLAQNFQFAAAEAERVGTRYTVLRKTVASSCQICTDAPVPLWLMRAERIVRDNETKQIHFENARFEIYGVTVAAFPYFRIPDPSVNRATGFLQPEIKSSETFGTGLKLPYFIVIDDATDITITPFLTTSGTTVIEGQYRRFYKKGEINFNGAFSANDDNAVGGLRGFIFADGGYRAGNGIDYSFSLKRSGDKSFLKEFDFDDTDRLASRVTAERQRGNEFVSLGATGFQSLRASENDNNIPTVFPEIIYQRYWDDPQYGGRVSAHASSVGLTRKLGRDVFKLGGGISWSRPFDFENGLQASLHGALDGWLYSTSDDPAFSSNVESILAPTAAIEVRYPLVRRKASNAMEIIEPIAQLVYREVEGDLARVPNEDSVQVEFDASNLFALDRFPGNDLVEEGLRLNLGMNYTHLNDDGWNFGLTLGRVLRTSQLSQFSASTGLNGTSSNFVAAANLDLNPGFRLSNQTLFDDDFAFSRNDIQARLEVGKLTMDGTYVYLLPDVTANSFQKRNELKLDATYRLNDNWRFGGTYRRNLATGRDVKRDLVIEYGNECLTTTFSVSRNFTNSPNVPPNTVFGLSVSLAGMGGTRENWPAHTCAVSR